MMGRQVEPGQLFYEFNLERHVPSDHLLRRIDRALDLSWLRAELAPFYSSTGRPSIDPELMIRMLLVGYCYGIRSERRLCDEVHLNLGYRWFCRLGLDGAVPDHSTFSKARHGRFREAEVFRRVFEAVVGSCMTAGLVGGEGFAVDASVIEADASYAQRVEGPVLPPDCSDPATAMRPVREYLAALDAAAKQASGEPDGEQTEQTERLAAEPAPAKALSLTDPASAWTSKGARKVSFAYAVNYLVDLRRAIIMDVAATPARWTEEVASTPVMIERTRARFGLTPSRLAGDSAYGSGLLIGWLMGRKIEPHVPVRDGERQTAKGLFTRADFSFERERDVYVCPGSHELKTTGHVISGGLMQYRAKPASCSTCVLKPSCTTGAARMVTRNVHEDEREHVRQLAGTTAFKKSAHERRKVEMLFAHLKRNLGLRRLRLRGLTGASDEFLLAATAQNLRRLARNLVAPSPPDALAPA